MAKQYEKGDEGDTWTQIGMMRKLNDGEFLDDMKATIAHLRGIAEVGRSPIGVTGFCMGGRLSPARPRSGSRRAT